MGFKNKETDKEFVCKQCGEFFELQELESAKCPSCKTDEYLFINDLKEDYETEL